MPAVTSYKVGTCRAARGGPVRWLTLLLESPQEKISEVALFFYEKNPPSLGFVNRETGTVNVNLPLSDFDATYRLVNMEQPVFVHWRVDPEEQRLASIDVSTHEEPVGEGAPDHSP